MALHETDLTSGCKVIPRHALLLLGLLYGFVVRGLELPSGFVAETLATNLNAMTAMALSPDDRIFLADQTGKVLVWKDGGVLDRPALTLRVTDYWERGLVGLTLHPEFPTKPHVFVLYVTDQPHVHHVLSRFTMDGETIDSASELRLFEGDDQSKLGGNIPAGHQGGVLRFGNDGKLYVTIGEQTAGEPAQRLDTIQGKILRLNADGSIPADNPFASEIATPDTLKRELQRAAIGKYRAIYAVGVRNSFGLAVQPIEDGGRVFFTDVGGSAFEEINELFAGANYGWPKAEGYSTNSTLRSPIYAYPPVIGRSICGGTFYPRAPNGGAAFPLKWRGKFLFVDFMAHWLRALDPDAPTNSILFASGLNGPVAVEVARDGSLLVLNRGTIWRDPKRFVANSGSLVRIRYAGSASAVHTGVEEAVLGLPQVLSALPAKLSATRLFGGLKQHDGSALHRYELNLPEWTPGFEAEQFFAIPKGAKLIVRAEQDWVLPRGAAVVKHFRTSVPQAAPKLIETRIIVAGESHAYGASYRWRDDESDADLVEDAQVLEVAPGRYWFFPGPESVLLFPTFNAAYRLDLSFQQLNRTIALSPSTQANQIGFWRELDLLEPAPSDGDLAAAPRFAHWNAAGVPVEHRVRSYLAVHCANCHQAGGPSRGAFDARFEIPLSQSGLINGEPVAGDLGIRGAKLVVPGDLNRSILYQRVNRTDFFRMPPVQYHNEPSPIPPVVAEWIQSLK